MNRFSAAFVFACLLGAAAPSQAATIYVSPRGNDITNPGTDSSSTGAFATIGKANAAVLPGDIVRLQGGAYTDRPDPARDGTSAAWITYIGDIVNPNNVTITTLIPGFPWDALEVKRKYISYKGMKFTAGGFSCLSTSDRDSLVRVRFEPTVTENTQFPMNFKTGVGGAAARNITLYDCFIRSNGLWTDLTGSDPGDTCGVVPANARTRYITLRKCDIKSVGTDRAGEGFPVWFLRGAQYWTIDTCKIHLVNPTNTTGGDGVAFFKSMMFQNNLIRDTHWYLEDPTAIRGGAGVDDAGWWLMRDKTKWNAWVRDTFDVVGPGSPRFFFSAAGACARSSNGNRYEDCLWRNGFGRSPFYQDGMTGDTLIRCTFASKNGNPLVDGVWIWGDNVVDHCTFADSIAGVGVKLSSTFGASDGFTGTLKLTNNLFYHKEKTDPTAAALYLLNRPGSRFFGDHNLYCDWDPAYPGGTLQGIRSLKYSDCINPGCTATTISQYSRPDSIPWRTGQLGTSWLGVSDLNSRWVGTTGRAGPKFADSIITKFDPTLLSGSGALGMGEFGSAAGAYQPGDVTAPAQITDLAIIIVGQRSSLIEFTAPGDDGSSGTCKSYEVRYATSPITDETSYAAATLYPLGGPVPRVAGTLQSVTVGGLEPLTQYWFAIKGIDEAGNKGAASNVHSGTTKLPKGGGGKGVIDA